MQGVAEGFRMFASLYCPVYKFKQTKTSKALSNLLNFTIKYSWLHFIIQMPSNFCIYCWSNEVDLHIPIQCSDKMRSILWQMESRRYYPVSQPTQLAISWIRKSGIFHWFHSCLAQQMLPECLQACIVLYVDSVRQKQAVGCPVQNWTCALSNPWHFDCFFSGWSDLTICSS